MTDIRNTSPAALPNAGLLGPDVMKPANGDATKGLPQNHRAAEDVLKELNGLSGTLNQILNIGKTAASHTIGTQAGSGAAGGATPPSLPAPLMEFSAEDMALILTSLKNKTSEIQLSNAKEGLNISKKKMDDLNANAMDKIKTMIAAAEKAAKMAKAGGIMNWLGKIGGFLGAVLGVVIAAAVTAASGGAAAPLLVLAVAGLVGASFSLAGQISTSLGGPPLDLASLAKTVVSKILSAVADGIASAKGLKGEALDAFKEKIQKYVGAIAQVIAGVVFSNAALADPALAGNMFGGLATIFGADEAKAAIVAASFTAAVSVAVAGVTLALAIATGGAAAGSAVSGVMNAITAVGQVAQAGMAVAQGALAVTQGAVGMAKSVEENKGSIAIADKKVISALIVKLQKDMEDGKDEIKKVIDEIMESITLVSQMINSGAQNRAQIISNMGGSRMNTI